MRRSAAVRGGTAGPGAGGGLADARARPTGRLDLKLLRMAVHGWWLGNPLTYKPGMGDLIAVARELANAGAASGTLVLGDGHGSDAPDDGLLVGTDGPGAGAGQHDVVRALLILRMALSRPALGQAAALAIVEVAEEALGRPCAARGEWEVALAGEPEHGPLATVALQQEGDAALVELRLAFDRIDDAWQSDGELPGALLARADWREVVLARVLHALDGRLRAWLSAQPAAGD